MPMLHCAATVGAAMREHSRVRMPKSPHSPCCAPPRAPAAARAGASEAAIETQIDDLLEEILHDDQLIDDAVSAQPVPAWAEARDEDDRIVVTGMGVLSPLGIGLSAFWNGLAEGRSGVGPITLCDPGESPSRIGRCELSRA